MGGVARRSGANNLDEVHNHHNLAWEKRHDGICPRSTATTPTPLTPSTPANPPATPWLVKTNTTRSEIEGEGIRPDHPASTYFTIIIFIVCAVPPVSIR